MSERFTLTIELGSEAMRTPDDVIRALGGVRLRLMDGFLSGTIKDTNGTVGQFEFAEGNRAPYLTRRTET